jgi:hypothetical protein
MIKIGKVVESWRLITKIFAPRSAWKSKKEFEKPSKNEFNYEEYSALDPDVMDKIPDLHLLVTADRVSKCLYPGSELIISRINSISEIERIPFEKWEINLRVPMNKSMKMIIYHEKTYAELLSKILTGHAEKIRQYEVETDHLKISLKKAQEILRGSGPYR